MYFEIIGDISEAETIAQGAGIRERALGKALWAGPLAQA
jgi:hypothetical protein